jgi:hypothetical protein
MQLLQLLDKDPVYQKALSDVANQLRKQSGALFALLQQLQVDQTTYLEKEADFEKAVQGLSKGWNGNIAIGQKYPTSTTTSTAATSSGSSSSKTPPIPAYLFGELDVTCDPVKRTSDPSYKSRCFLASNGEGTITRNFSASFYTNPNPALNEKTFPRCPRIDSRPMGSRLGPY